MTRNNGATRMGTSRTTASGQFPYDKVDADFRAFASPALFGEGRSGEKFEDGVRVP